MSSPTDFNPEHEDPSGNEAPAFSGKDLADELLAITSQVESAAASEHEQRPERLTDEQVGALLSAVGNHEAKAITFLIMALGPEHATYDRKELNKGFVSIQGKDPVWVPHVSNVIDYCSESFEPIGLIAKASDLGASLRYEVTDLGLSQGIALAGHLLQYSSDHPVSLKEIFGLTHSSSDTDQRSPGRRVQIMRELLTTNLPVSIAELGRRTGHQNDNTFRNHLLTFAKDGLIDIETIKAKGLQHTYAVQGEIVDYQPFPGNIPLTDHVVEAINDLTSSDQSGLAEVTVGQIFESLRVIPRYQELEERSLRGQIGKVLGHLGKQELVIGLQSADELSKVSIDDTSREILEDALNIIEQFEAQDPVFMEQGIEHARAILGDQAKLRELIAKAKSTSPEANNMPREEQDELVRRTVLSQAEPITAKALVPLIKPPIGKRFTERMIKVTLKRLMDSDQITVKVRSGENWYGRP